MEEEKSNQCMCSIQRNAMTVLVSFVRTLWSPKENRGWEIRNAWDKQSFKKVNDPLSSAKDRRVFCGQ